MSFLWDSNIIRHYIDDHPRLLKNLEHISRQEILLPIVVVAEQLRGRSESILKAEADQLAIAQERFNQTHVLLNQFQIFYLDKEALSVAARLIKQVKTRKRYADVLVAAQVISGNHILVTRNTKDFRDLLSPKQMQNWIDNDIR